MKAEAEIECTVIQIRSLISWDEIAPAGISPRGEIPRRHPSSSHVYWEQYLQFKYAVSILEKILICLNRGREESVGDDDVSIVCARKYEMVREFLHESLCIVTSH